MICLFKKIIAFSFCIHTLYAAPQIEVKAYSLKPAVLFVGWLMAGVAFQRLYHKSFSFFATRCEHCNNESAGQSRVEFGREVLRKILAFSHFETDSLELASRYRPLLDHDPEIKSYFEHVREHRQQYLNSQGRILGQLANHIKRTYYRQPSTRSTLEFWRSNG